MLLGLVTQMRNEMDIAKPFIAHVDALFDRVYLIDHQSVDGTRDLLRQAVSQRPGWKYYSLNVKTKIQTAVANRILHEAFADGVDFLFFLDADEFIEVNSREDLEKRIASWTDRSTIGSLRWKNCVCDSFDENEFMFQTPVWVPSKEAEFEKAILPAQLYYDSGKKIMVSNGNHMALLPGGKQVPSTPIGTLLHVPIRSLDQAVRKVILTVVSYRGYKNWGGENSFQYYDMLARIAEGRISNDDLRGYTLSFEKRGRETIHVTDDYLASLGYRLTTFGQLNIAANDAFDIDTPRTSMGFERIIANALDHLEAGIPDDVELIIKDGMIQIDQKALAARNLSEQNHNDASVTQLESSMAAKDREINELKAQISRYKDEVAAYVTSTSWRITRPFRWISGFLKNRKKAQ